MKNLLKRLVDEAFYTTMEEPRMAHASGHAQYNIAGIHTNGQAQVVIGDYHAAPLDDKKRKILRWLAAPRASQNYLKASKERHKDTGKWFLDSNQYNTWKTEEASKLWLYGIPGAGKTVLSSGIIEDLSKLCHGDPGRTLAYFFFDFKDSGKQEPHSMLRSLINQVIDQCDILPRALELLFLSCKEGLDQPSLDDLSGVLHAIIAELDESFILIDALDESKDLDDLLAIFDAMAEWYIPHLHIIFTSRLNSTIRECLEPLVGKSNCVELTIRNVNSDIGLFIENQFLTNRRLKKWLKDDKLLEEVKTKLAKKSTGMFRWAACQLAELAKCRTINELHRSLEDLPKDLDETYDRIIRSIDTRDVERALHILKWLVFSARPLTLEEVGEVVAIVPDVDVLFDHGKMMVEPSEIIDVCGSLVTITPGTALQTDLDENSGFGSLEARFGTVVGLAHFSVKEYLVSRHAESNNSTSFFLEETKCHADIANDCIAYLLRFNMPDPLNEELKKTSALFNYAVQHWVGHAVAEEDERGASTDLLIQLFGYQDHAYRRWTGVYVIYYGFYSIKSRGQRCEPSALYYAAHVGLKEVVQILAAELMFDVDTLIAACAQGNHAVARFLIESNVDVNAYTSRGLWDNALEAAVIGGHYKTVEMLLDMGADIHARGSEPFGDALQAASGQGNGKLVKMLLDRGADVNARNVNGGDALAQASGRGSDTIVKMLLDRGADVNSGAGASARAGLHRYALANASNAGSVTIVKMLLDKGAKINARDDHFGSAIQAASRRGHVEVVKMLLDKGANVNVQDEMFATALSEASYTGSIEVVKMLIDHGADVSAQSEEHSNAIKAALHRGHYAVIELLLDNGADVNAQYNDVRFNNALQHASNQGHEKIVEMLLDHGADVNAQNLLGRSSVNALQAASEQGYDGIVKVLLEHGAEVNAQNEGTGRDSCYALQVASLEGRDKIVKMLLEHGADVNIQGQGRHFSNALQAASYKGLVGTVETRLAAGADVNARGDVADWSFPCFRPVHASSCENHAAIVKMLFEHGADINTEGIYDDNYVYDSITPLTCKAYEKILKTMRDESFKST